MTDLCREFGISRKTGYKIFNRYKEEGLIALEDRSRRPVRYANQLPVPIERAIIEAKKDKPSWGARKIRELLVRRLAGDVRIPAHSTIHAVLDRHGLVKKTGRKTPEGIGNHPVLRLGSQCPLVCRLQGGVSSRQPGLLLPPDRHRPCLTLHPGLRGP
jgi:transposase